MPASTDLHDSSLTLSRARSILTIERVTKYFPLQDWITGRPARQEGFCV